MRGSESSTVTSDHREARLEAVPVVLVAIALQVLLAVVSEQNRWEIWELSWWIWLVLAGPELALALYLLHGEDPHQLWLIAIMFGGNALYLTALIGSILNGHEPDGRQLLLKGVAVWATNVAAFGLAFWELDHRTGDKMFQFPQHGDEEWRPRLFDYVYVSFTNSITFGPTDAMPLSRRAKLLMLVESAVSAIAILLVAARSVNIFR